MSWTHEVLSAVPSPTEYEEVVRAFAEANDPVWHVTFKDVSSRAAVAGLTRAIDKHWPDSRMVARLQHGEVYLEVVAQ